MTTQLEQDSAIKRIVDTLALKYGYPEGVLDSGKGTLTYDVSTPEFGLPEALKRINFRLSIQSILLDQPNMTITASFQQVTIKLPDWGNLK